MKRRLSVVFLAIALVGSAACSAKPVVKPTRPDFLERGIVFQLQADPKLNLYDGQPHTLLLCIYQLQDPNGFNQYREDYAGISKLLEGQRFDSSVASVKREFVQPGESRTLVLDRAEGARYVGVAAGYYNLDKDRATRLLEVPLVERKKGGLSREVSYSFAVLEASLKLGPEEFHQLERTQGQ